MAWILCFVLIVRRNKTMEKTDGRNCDVFCEAVCVCLLCVAGHNRDSELELLVLCNHWIENMHRTLVSGWVCVYVQLIHVRGTSYAGV